MFESLLVGGKSSAVNTLALISAANGFKDLAKNKAIGRYYTTALNTTTTKFNGSSFDFTNGYLSVGEVTDFVWTKDQSFTIEWWQYITGWNGNNWFVADGTGTSSCLKIYTDSLYLQTEGGGGAALAISAALTANTWQHIAIVQTNGVMKLYVNGVQKMSFTAVGNFGLASTLLTFGGGNGAYAAKGYFDQMRVSNLARYTAAFTPPTQPFKVD